MTLWTFEGALRDVAAGHRHPVRPAASRSTSPFSPVRVLHSAGGFSLGRPRTYVGAALDEIAFLRARELRRRTR